MSKTESRSSDPSSQSLAGGRGPIVWLDMDQKALDDAYDQSCWAPNASHLQKRRRLASERAIALLGEPRRVSYGPTEIEQLEIYRYNRPNAPIHVFIHGGAWRGGRARDSAYMAEMYLAAGAHLVIPDFVWVQDAGGSLLTMADQVRRAVAWVYQNASSFGGDPERLYISGHSSGGHLGGVLVTTDWKKEFGLPSNLIKGALLVSGMYDLKPVRMSKRREYVNFDDLTEETLSAQRHIDKINMPLIIGHGSLESPEFQRQSREFAQAVRAAGKTVEFFVGEGFNHFEMQETMGNPFGLGGRAALLLMGLTIAAR
ncbi:MAG: carboxylesterase family protein [Deltaproteobacteria bacterium]|nr:carboxylesterase family protein [Deltaproteobacteria bacterium]